MSDSPTGVVLGSVVVITATSVLRNARQHTKAGTTFKPVLYGFGLAVALLAVAIAAPGLAKGLAYLGLVGAFVVNGPVLFDWIGSLDAKQH